MVNPVMLNRETHQSLRVHERYGADCGHSVHLIPVVLREIPRLMAHYPIFFVKDNETGAFTLAALLGFTNEENLFLEGETWSADYVPLHIQRGPFQVQLQQDPSGQGTQAHVQVDMDDPRVSIEAAETGEAVFDTAGNATPYLERINQVLATLVQGVDENQALIKALLDNKLIESLSLSIEFANGEKLRFDNLYTIKPESMDQLDSETLTSLHKAGHLRTAYELGASLGQIQPLITRRNKRLTA